MDTVRFRTADRDVAALEEHIEPILDRACTWRYGGGAAAMRLTQYFRGEKTMVYLADAPADLAAQLRAVPDRNGPLYFLRAPATVAFDSPDTRCVHPLLAYADLISEADERARDAAQVLHEQVFGAVSGRE